MIFLVVASLILALAQLAATLYVLRSARDERAALLDRIQAPAAAVTQSLAAQAPQLSPAPAYVAYADDDALAEIEATRARLEQETQELVEQYEAAPPSADEILRNHDPSFPS